MKSTFLRMYILMISSFLPIEALACDFQWVGLYDTEIFYEKRQIEYKLDVFTEPNRNSEKLGLIKVSGNPDEGLTFFYIDEKNSTSIRFYPDMYQEAYDYGPYIHQTVLDRKGNWFLLPKIPFDRNVWVYIANPDVLELEIGEVYFFNKKSITITNIGKDKIEFRHELPSDMDCGEAKKNVFKDKVQTRSLECKGFFDLNMHNKLIIKYMKGC